MNECFEGIVTATSPLVVDDGTDDRAINPFTDWALDSVDTPETEGKADGGSYE